MVQASLDPTLTHRRAVLSSCFWAFIPQYPPEPQSKDLFPQPSIDIILRSPSANAPDQHPLYVTLAVEEEPPEKIITRSKPKTKNPTRPIMGQGVTELGALSGGSEWLLGTELVLDVTPSFRRVL